MITILLILTIPIIFSLFFLFVLISFFKEKILTGTFPHHIKINNTELERIKRIKEMLNKEETRIEVQKYINTNLVSCEKCECLIKKEDAIEGKKKIMKSCITSEDYIHTPYYCHKCAPNKSKK